MLGVNAAKPPFSIAQLNMGVAGADIMDLKGQATALVKLMAARPEVNWKEDWKLINVFYGGNDLCSYCWNDVSRVQRECAQSCRRLTLSTRPTRCARICAK